MYSNLIRRVRLGHGREADLRQLLRREWLITNGLGGYASGTISGMVSRRYHGLLVAALPAPHGRVMMFNHLAEFLRTPDGRSVMIGGDESVWPRDTGDETHYVTEFRLEDGLPTWIYEAEGCVIEKKVLLIHRQNTTHISYRLISGPDAVLMDLRPSVHFRGHDDSLDKVITEEYELTIHGRRYEIKGPTYPALKLTVTDGGPAFTHEGGRFNEIGYQHEADRGYHSSGLLWSPGYFTVDLRPNRTCTLIASTEDWPTILALEPTQALASDLERRTRLVSMAHPSAQQGAAAELVLAADQFIITPAGRVEDAARARAAGDEVRTVIAGYHWFTDWGRDTMISLEGLTLSTGRFTEAGWILRTFGHYIRDGLLPNFFPDGENEGVYHTADATLWYFHAIHRYLEATGDRNTLRLLLPKLTEIIESHIRGTRFGIGVDHRDGLLKQGAEGYQLTWMDAKMDGWVVTPRRGKAVEINALWYNALCLLANWQEEEGDAEAATKYREQAARARTSFNARFWCEERGHLFDVVDGEHGNDCACRPNQVFAVSLPNAVLDEQHWRVVMEKVREELLTPVGLRSLARQHPDYQPRYFGDLRARDGAYHQGTVWGWLIGPFIDGWLKVHPEDQSGARKWLEGVLAHLSDACVGSVSEIFDAEAPFTPRGCVAQAWSVAEALRCWVKTAPVQKADAKPKDATPVEKTPLVAH
jgi:predicted glycogen debranching enzyme